MAITSRTASNQCVYWSGGTGAHCIATAYFSTLSISCYNSGACDGAGTCQECSRYDVYGLKISTLSYTDANRDTSSDPASHSQIPLNVAIYNLRAKFAKCCYWQGRSIALSMDQNGTISPTLVLPGATGGTESLCSNTSAGDWQTAWIPPRTRPGLPPTAGSLNTSKFACNGAKTSCPYYTGPKFEYIKDDNLEMGDRVSASQIMELRYYGKDWSKYQDARAEYEKTFAEPTLWAWSGDFDDAILNPITNQLSSTPSTTSIPRVQEVRLFKRSGPATSFSSSLFTGPKFVGHTGTPIKGNPPNFPSLISELNDIGSSLAILWPTPATAATPYVFRTFRIGLNNIYVIVKHDTDYPLYAINVTKHPQPAKTSDEDFLLGMLDSYPDDVYEAAPEQGMFGVVFSVELLFNPEVNEIKVFTAKDNSADGSMYTVSCFVKHKFYHAHPAQTSFIDNYGQPVVEPFIDRFLDFSAEVSIKSLSKNEALPTGVLWDSVAYNKSTIYEIEEYFEEWIADWAVLNCNLVALTISNVNVNPTQSWSISGNPSALYISSVSLGVWVDRSRNPNIDPSQSSGLLDMQVVASSTTGENFPCNVVFAAAAADSPAFDRAYDRFKVVVAYTVYKQGPVTSADESKLKHIQYADSYVEMMPYEASLDVSSKSISVSGLSLLVTNSFGNPVKRLTVGDFENTLNAMYTSSVANEKLAIESFANGGSKEDQLKYLGQTFDETSAAFDADNSGLVFENGDPVTLSNFCELLSFAGYYEGTQSYRVVFSDETGRPIGIKRFSLLMQSSVPSCRDVEMFYRWVANGAFVNAGDIHSLLARAYTPLKRAAVLSEYYYDPLCGDHSLQTAAQTFYTKYETPSETVEWSTIDKDTLLANNPRTSGVAGALWYPYKACAAPKYHRTDPFTDFVLCAHTVEGFDAGLRRSYWEATRGPDIFWTRKIGPLQLIGCYWGYADGSYQTVQSPVFSGFTRVRSNHILGPFQTDRESVRISRHYKKRNLAVRNEFIRREGLTGVFSLSDAGSNQLFYSNGAPRTDEKPVWVHLVDEISEVNRTTSESKHPFTNVVMDSEGAHSVSEVVQTTRYALKDVMETRDLTRASERTTDGSLVYNPSEPLWDTTNGGFSSGKDVFWVFKDAHTVWAWLERPKDIERSKNGVRIGGVDLYNPSVDVWKKDLTSATRVLDGIYEVVYTPPTFNPDGSVQNNPRLAFAGGPTREVDWLTGTLEGAPSTWPVDPYDEAAHSSSSGATFQLYGKVSEVGGSVINGFLADGSGLHEFETEDGTIFETYRGIGVNPKIRVYSLPSNIVDLMAIGSGPATKATILALRSVFVRKTYAIDLLGYKFVKDITVEAAIGKVGDELFYLPTITVDGKLANDTWRTDVFRVSAQYNNGSVKSVTATDGYSVNTASSVRFKELRINIEILPQKRYVNITDIVLNIYEPVTRTEEIKVYDRKVNISTGNTGNRAHSDMLYYYGRTTADFGLNDVNYDEVVGKEVSIQDLKWLGRTARDTILTFNFMDPTGTVFDFPNSPVTSIDGIQQASSGFYHVPGPLNIRTKSQSLLTGAHVSDPIGAKSAGLSWSDTVATDEVSACANAVQPGIRDESLQECLFKEAQQLLGQRAVTVYSSYWHPDEESFFVGEVGLPSMPTWSMTLESTFASLDKVMRHPGYGCSSGYSNEYNDGKIHRIPIWQGLGHLMHLGNPVWNWTCTAVIMNKIGRHLGEELFAQDQAAYVSSRTWPPSSVVGATIESSEFYSENEDYWDNPSSYTGGTISQGIPYTIGQAMSYHPGGVPRGWLEELALFPITKSWPITDQTVINGYRKFGKR